MTLSKFELYRPTGDVHCEAIILVQGYTVTVPFTLKDADLTAHAVANGRETWEDSDIATLGSIETGCTISL